MPLTPPQPSALRSQAREVVRTNKVERRFIPGVAGGVFTDWAPYTPAVHCPTTDPDVFIAYADLMVQSPIHTHGTILGRAKIGVATDAGTGDRYLIQIVPAAGTYGVLPDGSVLGFGYCYDVSTTTYYQVLLEHDPFSFGFAHLVTPGSGGYVSPTYPFVFNPGDDDIVFNGSWFFPVTLD